PIDGGGGGSDERARARRRLGAQGHARSRPAFVRACAAGGVPKGSSRPAVHVRRDVLRALRAVRTGDRGTRYRWSGVRDGDPGGAPPSHALLGLGVPDVVLELTDFAEGSFALLVEDLRAVFAPDPVEIIDRPNRASGRR